MARLTGYVEINGIRASLNWTVTENGIVEGVGLSADGIVVTRDEAPAKPSPTPTPKTPVDAPAPVEPKSFEDMNKTELQVECSTRGLPTSGSKAELLERLTAPVVEEVVEEAVAEPTTEGEGNGESTSE